MFLVFCLISSFPPTSKTGALFTVKIRWCRATSSTSRGIAFGALCRLDLLQGILKITINRSVIQRLTWAQSVDRDKEVCVLGGGVSNKFTLPGCPFKSKAILNSMPF